MALLRDGKLVQAVIQIARDNTGVQKHASSSGGGRFAAAAAAAPATDDAELARLASSVLANLSAARELRVAARYARVGAIGSSQSAFGALHYFDCFDALLAISPLDAFVQPSHLSAQSRWLPPAPHARRCHVTIHVAEDNFLDAQYAEFCEAAQRRDPDGWTLRLRRQPGAQHPAYPGDEAVHEWVHEVASERVAVE